MAAILDGNCKLVGNVEEVIYRLCTYEGYAGFPFGIRLRRKHDISKESSIRESLEGIDYPVVFCTFVPNDRALVMNHQYLLYRCER